MMELHEESKAAPPALPGSGNTSSASNAARSKTNARLTSSCNVRTVPGRPGNYDAVRVAAEAREGDNKRPAADLARATGHDRMAGSLTTRTPPQEEK
jgi:hypothetical protein